MKSILGSETFLKCNFCLNWYNSHGGDWSAVTSLNICEGCFDRGKRSAYFRIVQPKSLSLFELQFRKCATAQIDTLAFMQGQANELVELIDQYERHKMFAQMVEPLKGYLTELVDYENEVLNRLQPVKQFVNKLYNQELNRVEKVWEGVLQELDSVGVRITDYRKQVTQQLRVFSCNVETGHKVLTSIKGEIENSLRRYCLDRIRDRSRQCQADFYLSGFRLADEAEKSRLRQPLTERPQVDPKMPHIDKLELGDGFPERKPHIGSKQFKTIRERVRGGKEDKENVEHLRTESTSRTNLQPVKSPRTHRMKSSVTQHFIKPPKRDRSADSSAFSEQGKERDHAKSQILELLKRKSPTTNSRLCPERVMKETIYQALEHTFAGASLLELIAYRTQHLEFSCYLDMLNWHQDLEVVKFVKIGLTDQHLGTLLEFLSRCEKVYTLVITNNLLTDESLDILYAHFSKHRPIRNIYLARNYIQPLRCKTRLHELRDLGVRVHV